MSDAYFIKLKAAGRSDKQIAARLGWSVEKVQAKWNELLAINEAMAGNKYADLQAQWLVFTNQYQLLGASLVAIGTGLGNIYQPEELKKLLHECGELEVDRVVAHLLKHCIILKPYVAQVPEDVLNESENIKGN